MFKRVRRGLTFTVSEQPDNKEKVTYQHTLQNNSDNSLSYRQNEFADDIMKAI